MARTKAPVVVRTRTKRIEEPTKRTRKKVAQREVNHFADDYQDNKSPCFWKCPCGGTVPDAPPDCVKAVQKGRTGEWCTDVLACLKCGDNASCSAYRFFRRITREIRIDDARRFEQLHPTPKKKDEKGREVTVETDTDVKPKRTRTK